MPAITTTASEAKPENSADAGTAPVRPVATRTITPTMSIDSRPDASSARARPRVASTSPASGASRAYSRSALVGSAVAAATASGVAPARRVETIRALAYVRKAPTISTRTRWPT